MWIDSMSPMPMHMTGTWDAQKNTLTYETKGFNPDGSPMTGRIVVVYHEDGSRTFTMFHPNPANPDELAKVMEVKYTLQKKRDGEHPGHHEQHADPGAADGEPRQQRGKGG